jgi:hypothetical protein
MPSISIHLLALAKFAKAAAARTKMSTAIPTPSVRGLAGWPRESQRVLAAHGSIFVHLDHRTEASTMVDCAAWARCM